MVAQQVLRLARQITKRRNHHIRDLDLTTEQADALRFFEERPDRSITAFKTVQGITHQTARLIVQRLAKRGLVQLVTSSTDARMKQVELTPAGKQKRQQLQQHGWQTSADLFDHFSEAEQQQLLNFLQRANHNLESDKVQ